MSDWDNSDGEDSKPAAPVQTQRYEQNQDYGNSNQNRGYGNYDQKRGYGNDQSSNYNQQRDNRYDGGRDNRQNFGAGRQEGGGGRQQNYVNGARRDDFRSGNRGGGSGGGGGGGGFNRYGGNDFKMEVDNSKVGMIIGKGGSKIREMQENHNVNIKVGRSALSAIFNAMIEHILSMKGHVLENMDPLWLSRENVREMCYSVAEKGSPYTRCFGFLDGTIRSCCRPVHNQRQFYNGHKRLHALKFQSLLLPNGIIANLFGPVNGRRHDSYVLAKSGLIDKLEQKFDRYQSPPYMYSDTGFPLNKIKFKRKFVFS